MAQDISTVKINELATSAINASDYFVKADTNGIAYKNTVSGLANFIGSVGVLGYKGALAIADTPTEDGFYFASENGTYNNAGGLVVDLNAGINIISVTEGQTVFDLAVIPVDLSSQLVQTVTEGDTTNAPSADAVFDYVPEVYIGESTNSPSKFWLDKAKGVAYDSVRRSVISSINNIFIVNAELGKTYKLSILAKNDATVGNRIGITNSDGLLYFTDNPLNIDGSPVNTSGWNLLRIVTNEGVEVYIEIDYSSLPDGQLVNGGNIYINPIKHISYDYFIQQYNSRGYNPEISIDTLASYSDLFNVDEYVAINIRHKKESAPGFSSDVIKLYSYAPSNLFRLYDNNGVNFDASRVDVNKKVYVEFDYIIISGSWRFVFWSTTGILSSTRDISFLDKNPSEVKRIRLELDLPNLDLQGSKIINYFSETTGSGEMWFGNFRMYQTDSLENTPLEGNELTSSNAQALNSIELNKQIADSVKSIARPAYAKKNIVLAGSSITWGDGNLTDGFGGYVDRELFKKEWANTLLATQLNYSVLSTDFLNPKLYSGKAKQITGVGSKVSFDMYGDELAICQVKRRTTDYATFTVKADGVLLGTFDNKNYTLGSDSENLIGDGSKVKFMLAHPYTYNHAITVNGVTQTVQINTGGYGSSFPPGIDVFIIRNLNTDGEVKHVAWFANPPANGDSIAVNYDYGKVVMYEGSTVGQTINDETNESNYGDGNTSFDPANPANLSSGLEFRYADPKSFIRHHFEDIKKRHIEIEITGGTNPYFAVDFVSNRFINFMNAGIGGWKLSLLLDNDNRNDWNNFFERFAPDLIVNESATNDDWSFGSRRISRILNSVSESDLKNMWTLELGDITFNPGTSDYTVVSNTGIIDSITRFSLISSQVVGSGVQVGDIIRIGNYYGDNNQVAVREVNTVDTVTGEIEWLIPISADEILNIDTLSDLVGAEIAIRDLSGYSDLYQQLLDLIQDVSPDTEILLTNPGLANYFSRQLWGYNIVHSKLAKVNNNVNVIDVTEWIDDVQSNIISGALSSDITATGATEYTLPFTVHRQGYKVLVNGLDVYGKDCYIVTGQGYTVDQNGSGADLDQTGNYNRAHYTTKAAKLVFFKNAPASGTITIQRADKTWSNDYTHPNSFGSIVYGKKYIETLKKFL